MADEPVPAPAEPAPAAPANDLTFTTVPTSVAEAAARKPVKARQRLTPEQFAAKVRGFDRLLTILVVVLTFFLASFLARNSDVWLHLASGRAIVQGDAGFGVDPFAHTSGGAYWANHNWLYDVLLYGIAGLFGGPTNPLAGTVLVVLKALLMTLLVAVLLALRRREQSMWLPVLCVGLAALAMAPRLNLQPATVSLLFLGLTLFFLAREGKPAYTPATRGLHVLLTAAPARLLALPVLFLLWANLDQWFFLGPLTLALFLLGEGIDRLRGGPDAPAPGEVKTLALALGVGLLACLINPHHYQVFVLPPELFPGLRLAAFKGDPGLQWLFYTPLQSEFFHNSVGGNVTGVAYFVLAALGVLALWLNFAQCRSWRIVVWLAFFALSLSSIRLIPFFAVIAGPITALNLQDYAARRLGLALPKSDTGRTWSLVGRLLTLVALVVLLLAAWPGWLQPDSASPLRARRVAWGIEIDPSLRKAAEQLDTWRREGALPAESRSFNFNPDVAHYCAWFCPGEKCFYDVRYSLLAGSAADYARVRKALRVDPRATDGSAVLNASAWQKVFRERGIDHLILGNGSDPTVAILLGHPREWTPLYLDGRTAIFAWHDPAKGPQSPANLLLNLHQRAFGPEADRAPAEGPNRPPHRPDWWDRYAYAPAPRPLEADEAHVDLLYYQRLGDLLQNERSMAWGKATVAGCVASAGLGMDMVGTATAVAQQLGSVLDAHPRTLGNILVNVYRSSHSWGPPGAPLVAMRAARRGLAANPDSAAAYASLGQALQILWQSQENAWAGTRMSSDINPQRLRQQRLLLSQQQRPPAEAFLSPWVTRSVGLRHLLRQVQLVWAWQHALELGHELQTCHQVLAATYWQMGFYDLSATHYRAFVNLLKDAGPPPGLDMQRFEAGIRAREKLADDFEKELADLHKDFTLLTANLPPRRKAAFALPYGLAREALTVLHDANPDEVNKFPEAVELLLYLHLTTGRLDELRAADLLDASYGLNAERFQGLPPLLRERYNLVLTGTVGNYAQAGQALDRALAEIPPMIRRRLLSCLQGATAATLQAPSLAQFALLMPKLGAPLVRDHRELVGLLSQEGELHALRGLLALEEGDIDTARRHLRLAAGSANVDFESQPIVLQYLQLLGIATAGARK